MKVSFRCWKFELGPSCGRGIGWLKAVNCSFREEVQFNLVKVGMGQRFTLLRLLEDLLPSSTSDSCRGGLRCRGVASTEHMTKSDEGEAAVSAGSH